MNKKLLSLLIVITIILSFVLYINFYHNVILSLLIIPGILMIVAFPKWSVAISVLLILSVIKYTLVVIYIDFSYDLFIELLVGTIINYSIFFTIAYFRIQHEKLLKSVQELTLIDQLTGVYNRRYFDLYMEKAIPLSERTGLPFHLIILDIDHFKRINDTYGHIFGDEVLKKVVDVIKSNIRGYDGLVRMGGEEFAILVPETTDKECQIIAERVRQAVETANFTYKGKRVDVTVSLGLSDYKKGTSIPKLIEQVDQALYHAKTNGRNQVVKFSHHD
jgi:diguanylate cyclase (GGDEF)-like protein